MRTNLITHFYCTECGHQLNIERDRPDGPTKVESPIQTPREPTGAERAYSHVYVEPCRHCIEKHTGPAKKLAASLKDLIANKDN